MHQIFLIYELFIWFYGTPFELFQPLTGLSAKIVFFAGIRLGFNFVS